VFSKKLQGDDQPLPNHFQQILCASTRRSEDLLKVIRSFIFSWLRSLA